MNEDGRQHASIRVQRRIDWIDTDASGVYHYSTFCRLADAAEALLFDRLDMAAEFLRMPRLALEVRFKVMLHFNDVVEVNFRVGEIGNTSIRFDWVITRGDAVAIEGSSTALLLGQDWVKKSWPCDYRQRLLTSGEQPGEILVDAAARTLDTTMHTALDTTEADS